MINKKILLPAFILIALVQLYVPAKMVFDSENVLAAGTEFWFKTAPVDPTDPFRGKYITLRFQENTAEVPNPQDWQQGEEIYVSLTTDSEGFAKIIDLTKNPPENGEDYILARVEYVTDAGKLTIAYPFDRFYMEESKAEEAELIYRKLQTDTNRATYALVHIKDGAAVLKDVQIDGIPITEMVKEELENKN